MNHRLSHTILSTALALCLLPLGGCASNTGSGSDASGAAEEAAATDGKEEEDTGTDAETDTSAGTSDEGAQTDNATTGGGQAAADEDGQRVGAEGVGFVTVPSTWVEFTDADGNSSIQWCDGTPYTIISLDTFDLSGADAETAANYTVEAAAYSVWSNIRNDGVAEEDIQAAAVTLAGREAAQVYAYYPDGCYLVCWLVEDDEGVIRYVSAEGPESTIMDAVGYVESTYEL